MPEDQAITALVIGGSGGIGAALVELLCERDDIHRVYATYRRHPANIDHPKLQWLQLDPTDEVSVQTMAQSVGKLKWVINAVGMLHSERNGPEKTIKRFEPDFFLENIRVNTLPTLLLAKHLDKNLKGVSNALFATVSAKVGSIADNRLGGWISYRSSKAALNMVLKTIAIEWGMRLPQVCVAAIHPGTTDTPLSKPFQAAVPQGKLFSPRYSASCMLAVLESKTPEQSGRFWSWDGTELTW